MMPNDLGGNSMTCLRCDGRRRERARGGHAESCYHCLGTGLEPCVRCELNPGNWHPTTGQPTPGNGLCVECVQEGA